MANIKRRNNDEWTTLKVEILKTDKAKLEQLAFETERAIAQCVRPLVKDLVKDVRLPTL